MSNPYLKSVRHLDKLDIYMLLKLYDVKSHAVGHAVKKLLAAGKRGAKDYKQDLMEAIDAIERELQMVGMEEINQSESRASDAIERALSLKHFKDPEPDWEQRHPDLRFAVRGENGQFVYGKDAPSSGEFWVRPVVESFEEQRIDVIGQNGNEGEHYEHDVSLGEILNWREKVDWSLASPHHQFAAPTLDGRIMFSMHQPMQGDWTGRPAAQ